MRQLLTPRMVALHVLVLLVVAVLARLGVWQLERLGEARERVDRIEQRMAVEREPVQQLLDGLALADSERLAALEFTPVVATGSWRPADEVLQRRSRRGQAGFDLLTPLDLTAGGTVLVRRGWVPFDNELRPPVTAAAPPDGTVTVRGLVERSIPQPTGPVAQRDPAEGELEIVFNADLERLGDQLVGPSDGPLLPMLVRWTSMDPPRTTTPPFDPPPPELDEGPHLSYAVQWFSFALIAAGMYAVWLRRRLRGDERAISSELRGS